MYYFVKITKCCARYPYSLYATDYDVFFGDESCIHAFPTHDSAEKWIKQVDDGEGFLLYEVTDGHDSSCDCVYRDESDEKWALIDKEEVPKNIVVALTDSNTIFTSISRGLEVWSAYLEGYRMCYSVKREASQFYSDDYPALNWSNPSYYKKKIVEMGKKEIILRDLIDSNAVYKDYIGEIKSGEDWIETLLEMDDDVMVGDYEIAETSQDIGLIEIKGEKI